MEPDGSSGGSACQFPDGLPGDDDHAQRLSPGAEVEDQPEVLYMQRNVRQAVLGERLRQHLSYYIREFARLTIFPICTTTAYRRYMHRSSFDLPFLSLCALFFPRP